MVTPQEKNEKLATALGVPLIYLKREDLHPYGSHKGRSIPRMMDHYLDLGTSRFVISSSGNAALAAARHAKKLRADGHDIALDIFVGTHADKDKVRAIESEIVPGIRIETSTRPLQRLLEMTRMSPAVSLRQSTDDEALVGYYELALELLAIRDLSAVFVGTSSGTTIQGLGELFEREGRRIPLYAVQTTACHPIALGFEESARAQSRTPSIAGAIVDKVARRKKAVESVIHNSGGSALIVTDEEIRHAMSLFGVHAGIAVSPNGALALAGLIRAQSRGMTFSGPIALVICGK